jgi:DNA-binding transcriptional regulator YdaS (Cro superfamily)
MDITQSEGETLTTETLPVQLAIDAAGGESKLARQCGITPQAVQGWRRRKRIPPERVLQIERITGISRHDLRADLYPLESSAG